MDKPKQRSKVLRVCWDKIDLTQAVSWLLYCSSTVTARERGKELYQSKSPKKSRNPFEYLKQGASCKKVHQRWRRGDCQTKPLEHLWWTNSKVSHYYLLLGRRWCPLYLKGWDHLTRAGIMVGPSARSWDHKGDVAAARETTKGRGRRRGSAPWILPESLAV